MLAHVLVVEDGAALREALVRSVQKAGYEVTEASDGETALTLLKQTASFRPPFDVVVSDIVMGEVNGIDVTRAARNHPAPPEVILLTSHGGVDTAVAALRMGAFDYLLKPVRLSIVLRRIADAAQQRSSRLLQRGQAEAWRDISEAFLKAQEVGGERGAVQPAQPAPQSARYLQVGQLRIDTRRQEVSFGSRNVRVTPIEYTILTCLSETPGCVVTYGVLARRTHGSNMDEREAHSLLRTHIRNLRHKIDRRYLLSVRATGYMLDVLGQGSDSDEVEEA